VTLDRAPWPALVVMVLSLLAAALRIEAASRPGLWADEIFSLAMASGHSLEHPAAEADPKLGDFIQPAEAESPAAFRRYAEAEEPVAGARRVIRAVALSDTSPPLYYLTLNWWIRAFGSGDAALRLFSVWWAVLSLPLLWLLGLKLGGQRVAASACLLFSFSPVAFYYSVEGRMYSMLWCLALALGWLTVRLAESGGTGDAAPWVLAGAMGLLTHYFFAFVWVACLAWLWVGGRPSRWYVSVLAALTLLAVFPWYVEVPASLARWRVTGGWLVGDMSVRHAVGRPLALAGSLLSGGSFLGGWKRADHLAGGLFLLLAVWVVYRRSISSLYSNRSLLLWLWIAGSCTGPLVFDVLRHTTTSDVPRYALAGLPAAMLLAALAMSQLPPRISAVFLGVVLLAWIPGVRAIVGAKAPRPWEPYPEVAAGIESWARPGDVVLVRSIPSGVIGVARYLRRDIPVASWVTQLGTQQVPTDLQRLLRGRRRLAVATIHDRGGPDQVEPWLQAHARMTERTTYRSSRAEVLYFEPMNGDSVFPVAQRQWE
jgi:Dolichyl-phosphate-mannose-protein mannosyltransferase